MIPRLKALRLVHPPFAYLQRLQRLLFREVCLIADEQHLDVVEKTDLSQLAPYVTRITFKPSMYSMYLQEEGFRKVALEGVRENMRTAAE